MVERTMIKAAFILSSVIINTNGFEFMKKFQVTPPIDVAKQQEALKKFGDKQLVVITGTSSGLGRKTAQALLRTGDYHVVGAVRDLEKMEAVAEIDEFDLENFTPMKVELNSFDSVRQFCTDLEEFKCDKPIDRLICNAGVYQPSLDYAKWSLDGCEQTMQINFLSHFLMISLLLEDISRSKNPRVIMVGSVTGNDNTVGGGGVYPIADLKELDGFKAGFQNPVAMADGYGFDGAKAYKDSKLSLMMMSNVLHAKFHKLSGVAFSSIYPGCIAESPLFREKRKWFRKYFPVFMKFITGGFVSEQEAGQRLFQVAHDPRCSQSGVYWSWNGGPREGRGVEALEKGGQISGSGGAGGGWDSIYVNDQSAKVNNIELGVDLFRYSSEITGAEWPFSKAITSPCPTLKVIGGISKAMIAREELKRMSDRPGFNADGTVLKIKTTKKAAIVADKVVAGVLRNTVGRVARFAGRRILGRIPDAAVDGSFQEEKPLEDKSVPVVTSTEVEKVDILSIPEPEKIDLMNEISESVFPMQTDQELIEAVMSKEEDAIVVNKVDEKEENPLSV